MNIWLISLICWKMTNARLVISNTVSVEGIGKNNCWDYFQWTAACHYNFPNISLFKPADQWCYSHCIACRWRGDIWHQLLNFSQHNSIIWNFWCFVLWKTQLSVVLKITLGTIGYAIICCCHCSRQWPNFAFFFTEIL